MPTTNGKKLKKKHSFRWEFATFPFCVTLFSRYTSIITESNGSKLIYCVRLILAQFALMFDLTVCFFFFSFSRSR